MDNPDLNERTELTPISPPIPFYFMFDVPDTYRNGIATVDDEK